MKRLAGRHTRRINQLERKTGTAWEDRYKCSPIESDRYLLACTRYVELNPVRAGMVDAGIVTSELNFIRDAVQRNQLTGSEKFALEIQQRTGERILNRGRGRPRNDG